MNVNNSTVANNSNKEWFGIADKCCIGNIKILSEKGNLGQCQICKRMFTR